MEKSYIQKITPFIDNMRVQSEEGSQPTSSLIPFKVGDKFVDFHFNTDYTPQISDFEYVEFMPGLNMSIVGGIAWYIRGEKSDTEYEAFAVQYIPKGTPIDSGSYITKNDILMFIDFNGNGIYYNAGAVEYLYDVDHEELTEGWQVGSFSEYCKKYDKDWGLDEESSYGELLAEVDEMQVNYSQSSNGKVYGFKPEDIKE